MAVHITVTEQKWPRLPGASLAAALVAFATLALTTGFYGPVVALACGLLLSYVVPARMESATLTKWTARIIVYALMYVWVSLTAAADDGGPFDVRRITIFGLLCASELTLQAWRRQPTGGSRAPAIILLSGMVFLTGCNTDTALIRLLAPLYFFCLALSLRTLRADRAAQPLAMRRAALWLGLAAPLAALLVGAVLHFGFNLYRGNIAQWGMNFLPRKAMSETIGMTGQPILSATFDLRGSQTRILRLENYAGDPHLRGMSFENYTNRAWGPSLEARHFRPQTGAQLHSAARGPRAQVTVLQSDFSLLFTPLDLAGLVGPRDLSVDAAPDLGGPFRIAGLPSDNETYDLVLGNARQGLLTQSLSPEERARCLDVPKDIDPGVPRLAQTLVQPGAAAPEKIDAVHRYLLKNNGYSLTTDPGSGDPISGFILHHKSAHCEYFASAATMLLRCLHVPTRYVSGYYAHESGGRNVLTVRQQDAHAWAESWIDGQGWVVVDATPDSGRPDETAPPVSLGRKIGEWFLDRLAFLRTWLVEAPAAQKGAVFGAMVAVLLLAQIVRWLRARRTVSVTEFRYSSPDVELAALAAAFEEYLRHENLPCPPERPWREHLGQARVRAESRAAALGFVQDYDQARFGRSSPDLTTLRARLRALQAQTLLTKEEALS